MKRIISILAVFAFASVAVSQAQNLILPDLLKGDIVLQQQTDARIWGKALPGADVTVHTPWNDCN
jgi:sialate O-acetylesterase